MQSIIKLLEDLTNWSNVINKILNVSLTELKNIAPTPSNEEKQQPEQTNNE